MIGWIPRWLIVLAVIAVIIFLLNALGIIHIHFNIGGSVAL